MPKRSDVFISYDRKSSAAETKSLASDLEAAGFSTWWDTQNMRGGDDFHDAIDKNLDLCKAAIIIWTEESIKSKWVRSEADHALRLDKLINTHVQGVDPAAIPKPFNQIHSVALEDRAAIIGALRPYVGRKRRTKLAKINAPLTQVSGGAPEVAPVSEPEPKPRPRFSRSAGFLTVGLIAVGLAGLAYALWPGSAVPQWSFDNKGAFLGEDIPLAWTYEPPEPGMPVRFEVESGEGTKFEPAMCTDAHHYYVGNVNATRAWRLRAVADCAAKAPVSDWSAPIVVTQYDSVFQRIKAKGEANIYVSNSQDQDLFKWGDQGFDIDLTNLVLRDLSARIGREVKLVLNAVDWSKLLPEAGAGNADFSISSITSRAYREDENKIRFSDPYFCTTHALMYRRGTPDGDIADMVMGKIVGAQRNSTNYRLADLLSQGGRFKLEAFENTESLKNALRASRIDFAVTDTSFAQSAQLDTRLSNGVDQIEFKEFGPRDVPPSMQDETTQSYAIAVRKGEIELLGAINETIEGAKADGELKILFDHAAKAYEIAHGYKPGSRNLGERPWECASQAGAP